MSGPWELLFTCVICRRDVRDYRDLRNGRDRHISPICNGCERQAGNRKVNVGAFMDRRLALRGDAIANALSQEAHHQQWSATYGRP